jgi:ubiquinone/menaquinone biosynthesis C-methylase UbiE
MADDLPENERPPLARIIEEELIDYRIRSHFSHPKYVRSLTFNGDERVLEFGSGGGCLSRALAQVLQNGGSLTCVDTLRYWITKAQSRLKPWTNIEFLTGDVTRMQLPEAKFDAVVIHFVLHDVLPDARSDVMDALAKTLHPEGVLHIREPAKPGHGMPVSEIRALMRAAGLRELRAGCTKSFQWKWICDGIFRKSW